MELEKLVQEIRGIVREELKGQGKMFMNIEEAAEFTGFSVATLYTYINKKTVPYIKKGGKVMFKRESLIDWMEEGEKRTQQKQLARTVGQPRVFIK